MRTRAGTRRALIAILATAAVAFAGLFAVLSIAGDHPGGSPSASRVLGSAGLAPHPFPIARGSPPLAVHNSHWWAGAAYSASSLSPTQVRFTLTIPDATPSNAEFYYVLMSVWDNAGSYDQVGIANNNGAWGWTYSWTSACAGTYHYNPAQATLTRGLTYEFFMNISGGTVVFSVAHNGSTVAKLGAKTGGTHFVMSQTYTCSGSSYYDFTDYEEAYTTVQVNPSFSFRFVSNFENNKTIANWSNMGTPPGGGKILFGPGFVTVANQKFYLTFGPSATDSVTLAAGTAGYNSTVVVHHLLFAKSAKLNVSGLPTGFSVTLTPPKGAPTFTSSVAFKIGSTASAGTYELTIAASDALGNYTYVTLEIVLL